MNERDNDWTGMEVAVVGMAGRFPGARNIEQFWANLRAGVESITRFSDEELRAAGEGDAQLANPSYIKVGRTIEDDDLFDAALFSYSPREAELVDPQQRMFLECAWEALEHAGYDTERFSGPVGVYSGIKLTTYLWNIYSNPGLLASVGELNAQIANDRDYVATRVSYKLGLGGPSLNVQSACSTSLVAVHLACQGLLAGETDMALAGGVSVRTQQTAGYYYREGDILSPDGRIRSFDADAKGTIFGSGLGVVVLRRLEDALADGDRIWGVIRGTAVSNDGAAKIGFTAPGADGQERVIRAAHAVSGVDPETIGYIEAHGTGTQVGDPIEMTALTRAFRAKTDKRGFCAIGSVKTNIGHLASAAGVAGLIKTLLALDREELPASINFERPNPQIDFESSPFYVQTALTPWPRSAAPRRAGISAFGIGGTNAHAIVEEAPEAAPSGPSRPWQLLLLSARTESALEARTAALARHLESAPEMAETPFADVAYTLALGRRQLEHRRALVCRDRSDAIRVLEGGDSKRPLVAARETGAPQLAFLFSGQGSQHVGMLADLYAGETTFRAEIDRCAEILSPHFSPALDLREVLYPAPEKRAEAEALMAETRLTQPALFTVEYALARQLAGWGIEPQAMLGHSIGEYVAACLAGVFSLEDALALVAARGRLMQAVPPGAMLTVSLPAAEVEALLGDHPELSLAATNAPKRAVVAGPFAAIEALEAALSARGVAFRRLHTSHAFHSAMMDPALAPFRKEVERVALSAPNKAYVSNVTGDWITEAQATDPEYWVRHLRGTVRFAEGLKILYAEPDRALLEVGPGTSLAQLARQHPDRGTRPVVASARQPKEEQDDLAVLLGALGQLWMAGVEIDQKAFFAGQQRRRAVLPTYPFERRRFYIEPATDMLAAMSSQAGAKRLDFEDWFYVPYWKPSSPALPRPVAELVAELGAPRFLVFEDAAGLGAALSERLLAAGVAVATVVAAAAGSGFAQTAPDRFAIDPGQAEACDRLLEALAAAGGLPARIVHCFAVGGDDTSSPALRATLEQRSFYSLLYLGQALGRQRLAEKVEIAVVATGLFRARGDEAVTPEKATLLGPCKVLPQENPRLGARAIDVEWPGDERALDRLCAEICDPRADVGVALRGDRRFVQAWEPIKLDRTLESRLPFVDRGVYLITGGFGGVGLTIAESLATGCRARLVLTGRSALPPRESWDAHLAAQPEAEGDAQSRAMRAVLRLEALGAEVLVARADVSNLDEMRAAVAAAHERFGSEAPIRGVVHAAGLPGGGIIQLKDPKVAAAVLAPKLAGARVLETVLAEEPLDFFVLCSSTIAIYGNFGQVDYCAANSFLDAFAEDLSSRRGITALSINYGAWRDVGMAVHARVPTAATAASPADLAPAGPRLHPLVHALVEDGPERKVFLSRLTPGDLWVIDEHLVAKTPAVPGTGCLEMARAAFTAAFGDGPVELSDVYFLTPLMVPAGREQEVRIVLERGKDEAWSFRIASRASADAKWQEHAFGKARAGSAELGRRDLSELKASASLRTNEVTAKLLDDREGLVWWGPRWQSLKRVHLGDGRALARLELPEEFVSDLATMPLHPALLDVATGIVGMLEEGSHLPFSYRRLRFSGRMPKNLWSSIRRGEDATSETVTADVSLLDDDGRAVVEIEGFTLKTVGAAVARLESQAEAKAAPASPSAAPAVIEASAPKSATGDAQRDALLAQSGMSPAEGVEAFRRILAARAGRQVAVSPRDLRALLEQMQRARVHGPGEAAAASTVVRAAHPRSVQTPFVEPATEIEKRLAEIWQRVLGIDAIGLDDNFYEMGGDSVLGIQIVAAARDAGVDLQSSQLFEHQTLRELGRALDAAAGAAVEPATAGPVRFELAGLSAEALARLLDGREETEDAYPLSPLQEGFLFHTLASGGASVFVEQITATLLGDVDPRMMAAAWQRAVDRHPALRSWFAWDDLPRPLQIVAAKAELPIRIEDLRDLPPAPRAVRVAEGRRIDRETPFDLAAPPLMRVRLARTEERTWEVTWSHHHLLMDGWSSPMLVTEVFNAYEVLRGGGEPQAPPARRFGDYIAWLETRDAGAAERFFRRYRMGLKGATALAADRPADGVARTRSDYLRLGVSLSAELDAGLREAAKREQVSLSILAATGWALLLGQEAGSEDVVYAASVSGRPPELAGVEETVGCFINALPVRARLSREVPLGDWFRAFQSEQAELLGYSYASLVEVRRWAGLPADRALFEAEFGFWNFPFVRPEGRRSFDLDMPDYDVATDQPLSLRVIPYEGFTLQLTYDQRRFDAATIEHKLRKLERVLALMVERPRAVLGELLDELAELDRERLRATAAVVSDVAREKLKARRRGAVAVPGV
jgi:acyl transferase domain-containing protein